MASPASRLALRLSRRAFHSLALATATLLTACASPPTGLPFDLPHWSGRLALRVDADSGTHPQSVAVLFDLQGSSDQGELILETPLGNRLAQLSWDPTQALLITSQQQLRSTSVDELLQTATGTPAPPVQVLFDWLSGVATSAPGWSIDLSRHSEGLITATRTAPAPQATLRIAFSR